MNVELKDLVDKLNDTNNGFELELNENGKIDIYLYDLFEQEAKNPKLKGDLDNIILNIGRIDAEDFYYDNEVFDIETVFEETGLNEWITSIENNVKREFQHNLELSIIDAYNTPDTHNAHIVVDVWSTIMDNIGDIETVPELNELYDIINDINPDFDKNIQSLRQQELDPEVKNMAF